MVREILGHGHLLFTSRRSLRARPQAEVQHYPIVQWHPRNPLQRVRRTVLSSRNDCKAVPAARIAVLSAWQLYPPPPPNIGIGGVSRSFERLCSPLDRRGGQLKSGSEVGGVIDLNLLESRLLVAQGHRELTGRDPVAAGMNDESRILLKQSFRRLVLTFLTLVWSVVLGAPVSVLTFWTSKC
jgi:hypothetical protein